MNDADEFTFCKVEREVDDDDHHSGSPKRMPDIESVTLEDNDLKGTSMVPADIPQSSDPTQAPRPSASSSRDNNANEIKNSEDNETGIAKPIIEGSASQATSQKSPIKRPSVRAKVPFEKGYSQMDWLKLTRTHPDLAGLNGRSNRRLISMDEVKQHKSDGSIWTVLKGHVYNISPYMKFHPGGVDLLMKAAGKDCTSLFNKYHAWVNAEFLLEKCLVGMLDTN